jgi:tol-pal system protein YbgF
MCRLPILPRSAIGHCFGTVLAVAAMMLFPAIAQAQDRTLYDRLDRIERDLNMLQRQVYRGAPQSTAPGDPNAAAGIEVRMERLEEAMRSLTGRVEEIANGLVQLKQRIEQINSDVDMRLGQGGPGAPATTSALPAPPGRPGTPGRMGGGEPGGLMPPGTVVPPPANSGPTPIFGTLTPPGSAPAGRPPDAAATPPAPGGSLPSGSANDQFNHAFALVKQGNYTAAEAALRAFIQQHPNEPLAANAQFWLGETYFARSQFMEAASAFAEGYKRYPRGPKAAEELLRLGMSLARAEQKQNACVAFTQLERDFPNPGAAIKERANAEKRRLGCA